MAALTMKGFHAALGEDRAGTLAVLEAGTELGLDPDELAVVIERESGWNPAAVNGQARGLIQLRPIAREDIGMTADPATLSRAQQAPWIKRFYERVAQIVGGPIPRGDLYLATFRPADVGKPDNYVIFAANTEDWKNNAVFLRESLTGPITAGSVRRAGSPQGHTPMPPTPGAPARQAGSSGWGAVLLVGALGAGWYYWGRT